MIPQTRFTKTTKRLQSGVEDFPTQLNNWGCLLMVIFRIAEVENKRKWTQDEILWWTIHLNSIPGLLQYNATDIRDGVYIHNIKRVLEILTFGNRFSFTTIDNPKKKGFQSDLGLLTGGDKENLGLHDYLVARIRSEKGYKHFLSVDPDYNPDTRLTGEVISYRLIRRV